MTTSLLSEAAAPAIEEHLRGLSRALVQKRVKDVYTHHRELYLIGEEVIPRISRQLLAYRWKTVKYKEQLALLAGLLSLALDIDEDGTREIAEKIEAKGCSHAVRSIMRSILSFSLENFVLLRIRGVTIYRARELDEAAEEIENNLTEWLSAVPEGDLDKIDRIYVVPPSSSLWRGSYAPILCKIAIDWDVPPGRFPQLRYLLRVEHTLYHEIGHHILGHNKLGQDPDQEEEADDYASDLIRENHPFLQAVEAVFKRLSGRQQETDSEEEDLA
jgi:hypothetical protein